MPASKPMTAIPPADLPANPFEGNEIGLVEIPNICDFTLWLAGPMASSLAIALMVAKDQGAGAAASEPIAAAPSNL